jgi:hypothetical protein
MRTLMITLLFLPAAFMLGAPGSAGDEPKVNAPQANKLVGTWKLVSAKYGGEEFKFPEGTTHIKHITPTHYMWATYDQDGKVTRASGGTYTLDGDQYEEHPEYGIGPDSELLKGKVQSFKCKVDGNTWHHDGKLSNDLVIEEVWERLEKK